MDLEKNMKAPAFSLKDQTGKNHKLSDYKGKWILLYFYPKDNTPGCTTEACEFKSSYLDLSKAGAVVLGVSADSVESHSKFADKYKLPFPVLADTEKKVLDQYGAWKKKSMFGKTFMGIKRMSFLIDPQGNIAKIYKTVKPAEHAKQVLEDVKKMK